MATPPQKPLNPNPSASHTENLFNLQGAEKKAASLGGLNNSTGSAESGANPLADLKNTEEKAGLWDYDLSRLGLDATLKIPRIKKTGVGWLIGGGTIGIAGVVVLILALLIPMKLQSMISNIMTSAAEVPAHAVEQRAEYLITRALAVRMLAATNSSLDAELLFCKGGGVSCSLFKTYTTSYFETKYGIKIDAQGRGVTSLGANATSWSVAIDPSDTNSPYHAKPDANGRLSIDESGIEKARGELNNAGMKKLISSEVSQKMERKTWVERALMRKILREKYGVRLFSGPKWVQNTREKITTVRSNMKASITKNTIGKISPRFATYMTCLSDPAACNKLKEGIKADIENADPSKDKESWDKLSDEEKARQTKAYEAKKSILPDIEAGGYGEESGKVLKKVFSKSMMKTLGFASGAAAGVGAVDIIFKMVGSIEDGGPEMIGYDIATQAYTGFSTDIVTTVQKVNAGDMDLETLQVATELFDSVENSPLYQAESNPSSLTGNVAAASGGYTTSCKGSDGEETQTVLAKGEYICPEEYAVKGYTNQLADNPIFSGVGDVAKLWNSSIGVGVDWVNGVFSSVIEKIPGFNAAMEKVGGAIGPLMEKIVSMIFDIPAMGPGELGSHNYTALSGGLRVSQNALMEQGVDSEGKAMGGGGTVLSDAQLAVIHNEATQDRNEEYASKSLADKIFDTSNQKSFMSQFVARIPIGFSGLASLPISSLLGALTSSSTANAAASSTALNPFHLPMYGYAADDIGLLADPGIYTEESCAASAKAREESYYRGDGELIPTYHKSDLCALEKVAVGAGLAMQGVEGDKYSFQSIQDVPVGELKNETANAVAASIVGDVSQDSTNVACASGTTDLGNTDGYKNGTKVPIKLCSIPGTKSTDTAKYGAQIVVNSRVSGAIFTMINQMKSDLGVDVLNFTSSFRDNTTQSNLYAAWRAGHGNVAAPPKYSNHQLGTAVDFKLAPDIKNTSANCVGIKSPTICVSPKQNAVYDWLTAHAASYGYSQLYNEYWHWEVK